MNEQIPLAARLRPQNIDSFLGQEHILSPGLPLYEAIKNKSLHSVILWGPPGTGKTTLARILASSANAELEELSAVLCGVKDIRAAVQRAQERQQVAKRTVFFVDEVHRFNKAQQDAFLPHVETGLITFIGATTENPAFELNNALLSRAAVYILKPLQASVLTTLVNKALALSNLSIDSVELLIEGAQGDARKCLNYLELAIQQTLASNSKKISRQVISNVLNSRYRTFDKGGDNFYDQISALHKSVRGSAPDAALYWCMSMLASGVSHSYILRRLLRIASEDIGNADPRALEIVLNAWSSFERLGSEEGELVIAQAVLYLACAPKSNAVYQAYKACKKELSSEPLPDVPLHLRNAPTKLAKALQHGKDYRYPHDYPHAYVPNEKYFPNHKQTQYYFPVERGLEIKIKQKVDFLKQLDNLN